MEYASVDLPERFGPMIACVLPASTVRLTPRRISLSSTETCRSRISRVATASTSSSSPFGCSAVEADEHVAAVDLGRVHRHRLGGGQAGGLPCRQVEARPVQP